MSLRSRLTSKVKYALLAVLLSIVWSASFSWSDVEYPPALGPQSLVVVTVEFSDDSPEYYPSVSQIEEVIGVVNDYYLEVSYGQTWFDGYVTKKFYEIGSTQSYNLSLDQPGLGDWWALDAPTELVTKAVLAADREVDYSRFRHVVVLLVTPRGYGWWLWPFAYPYADLWVETDDGVVVEDAILLQGRPLIEGALKGWVNPSSLSWWVSLLGQSLGLPDDTMYRALEDTVIFCDPMATGDLVHMLAWNKIALGWLSPGKIEEVPLGETVRVVLDPIELDTTGTLVVKVMKTPELYWLVEARRPIGYDADLPTPRELSLDNATRYSYFGHPPVEGILVVPVKHPSSATPPLWEGVELLRGGRLGVGVGETAIFVDEEENLLVAVVGEVGDSYVVEISTADEAVEIRGLIDRTVEEIEEKLGGGVADEEVEAQLIEAESRCELALQSYLQYDLESARNLAEEAESLVEHATQLEDEHQALQLYQAAGAVIAALVVVATFFWWIRRRKESAVASTQ